MRILIAYGTKMGGTEGLAAAVSEGVAEAGHEVVVRSGRKIDNLDGFDAVIVGGALYAWRWHRDARRFVKRLAESLQQRPVWFFSSGPLDDSASQRELPPTRWVRGLMRIANARGHITFGGRLSPEVKSPIKQRGDWRDLDRARTWGREIGAELQELPVRVHARAPRGLPTVRRLAAALCLFTGITAVGGGIELLLHPHGAPPPGPPLSLLENTPFETFVIPGLLLLAIVGLGNLWAAGALLRRRRHGELLAGFAGGALVVWIVTEMVMMRTTHWLQLLYLAVGLITWSAAAWLWFEKRALGPVQPARGVAA